MFEKPEYQPQDSQYRRKETNSHKFSADFYVYTMTEMYMHTHAKK